MLKKTLSAMLCVLVICSGSLGVMAMNQTPPPGGRPTELPSAPGARPDFTPGLQRALENAKANGSPSQRILEALIESDGDVSSIARTLGDIERDEVDEIDEETVEALTATAEEVTETLENDEEMDKAEKGSAFAQLARFHRNVGQKDKLASALESVVKNIPSSVESYKELGRLYREQGLTGITTFVNGLKPQFDVPPRIQNGRTLVPFRALAEALGAEVDWIEETNTVVFERDGTLVHLTIGSVRAFVNGLLYILDVPAFIENGRTIVPLRFISEALDAEVLYEEETEMIIVYDEPPAVETE